MSSRKKNTTAGCTNSHRSKRWRRPPETYFFHSFDALLEKRNYIPGNIIRVGNVAESWSTTKPLMEFSSGNVLFPNIKIIINRLRYGVRGLLIRLPDFGKVNFLSSLFTFSFRLKTFSDITSVTRQISVFIIGYDKEEDYN